MLIEIVEDTNQCVPMNQRYIAKFGRGEFRGASPDEALGYAIREACLTGICNERDGVYYLVGLKVRLRQESV